MQNFTYFQRLNFIAVSIVPVCRVEDEPDASDYEPGSMDDLLKYMATFPGDDIPATTTFNWTL
jgi:hypothetical protein